MREQTNGAAPMTNAGSVRGPLGGWEQFVARGDELVRVEMSNTEIAVVVETPTGETLARTAIPYPSAGCGGHEILLSAKERYLAMFLYSGQSEVGYELFYFRPHLQHISSFGYVFGEGTGPVFSSDGEKGAVAQVASSFSRTATRSSYRVAGAGLPLPQSSPSIRTSSFEKLWATSLCRETARTL